MWVLVDISFVFFFWVGGETGLYPPFYKLDQSNLGIISVLPDICESQSMCGP